MGDEGVQPAFGLEGRRQEDTRAWPGKTGAPCQQREKYQAPLETADSSWGRGSMDTAGTRDIFECVLAVPAHLQMLVSYNHGAG